MKIALTAALFCFTFIHPLAPAPCADKPNIVLFLVDDMGWMDCGVYGSKYYETPHMDRLAGQSMLFTDAYAHPLFDPATDQRTGYRTRSILCVPIRDAAGEVIAVAQVLNKQDAEAFDEDDERELAEFAGAMSVILESWWEMSRRRAPNVAGAVGEALG